MGKRQFRSGNFLEDTQPQYPTLAEFSRGRRRFLQKMGVALLSAGALSGLGCDARPLFEDEPPLPLQGKADSMQLPRDAGRDISSGIPDAMQWPHDGLEDDSPDVTVRDGLRRTDTIIDSEPHPPDGYPMAGAPLMPDAGGDAD